MHSYFIPYILTIAFIVYFIYRIIYIIRSKHLLSDKNFSDTAISFANPYLLPIRIFIYLSIVILIFFAYFFPISEDLELPHEGSGIDILFLVDTSLSMNAIDVPGGRLTRFKQIILPMLPELEGNRLGLLVYAGSPFLYCPLTSDLEAFSDYVKGLDTDMVGDKGTDIGKVLNKAKSILNSNKILRNRIVVLVSDGEDHEQESIPNLEEKLLVWGIGSNQGSAIYYKESESNTFGYVTIHGTLSPTEKGDDIVVSYANLDLLKDIASQNKGSFYDLTRNASSAFNLVDISKSMEKNKILDRSTYLRFQKVHYFLIPILLLMFLDISLVEYLLYQKKRV